MAFVWKFGHISRLEASILHLHNQKYDGIPFFYKQYHMKQPRKFYFLEWILSQKSEIFVKKKNQKKGHFVAKKVLKYQGKR